MLGACRVVGRDAAADHAPEGVHRRLSDVEES